MRPRVGVLQFKAVCPEGNEHPLACGITYELARRLTSIGGVDANAYLLEKGGDGAVVPGGSELGAESSLGIERARPAGDSSLAAEPALSSDSGSGARHESDFILVGRAHVGDGLLLYYRLYEADSGRLIQDGCVTGMRSAVFRLLDDLAQECRSAMGWMPEPEGDDDFSAVQDSVDFDAFTEYCLGRACERPHNALGHLERALELEPSFRLAIVEYLSFCYAADDLVDALRYLDEYLAAFPDDLEILIAAANLCLAFNRIDEGMAFANRALELRPGDVEPHVLLARFLFFREMTEAASAHLDAALSSHDRSPEAKYCLGRYFLDLGDVYRARDYFEQCLEADSDYLVALRDLQCCYYELGDFTLGIRACERLLEADPTDAGTHYNLGLIYQRLGRVHLAVKFFEEAVRRDPTFYKAIYMMGEYEMSSGRIEMALRQFEKAHRALPGAAEALGRMGDCHYHLGRVREAYRHYAWARREDPLYESPRAYLIEGVTFAEDGDFTAAREKLRGALALDDDLAEAWSELAWVLLGLGKSEPAWRAIERAVDLEPDRPEYQANLVVASRRLPWGIRFSGEVRRKVREARERLRWLASEGDTPSPATRRRRRTLFGILTWHAVRS
jgi:tetratricopeptide (TPR) repeat protein